MEKLDITDTSVNLNQMARTQSLITGATLLYSGINNMKHAPTVSVLKTIFGGYLIYRGMTGHCHLNQVLERSSSND